MGEDDYDDYSKELSHYRKSKDRGRGTLTKTILHIKVESFNTSPSLCNSVFFSISGMKGNRGRGRGKGGRGMMRGGRGRNRGRGRGDMGMDDDHHGDLDNGVSFHISCSVMFIRSLNTWI